MTDDEVLGLHENIKKLRAERVLEKARVGEIQLSPDGWFDYVMDATGDYWQAERAHNMAAKESLRKGGDGYN